MHPLKWTRFTRVSFLFGLRAPSHAHASCLRLRSLLTFDFSCCVRLVPFCFQMTESTSSAGLVSRRLCSQGSSAVWSDRYALPPPTRPLSSFFFPSPFFLFSGSLMILVTIRNHSYNALSDRFVHDATNSAENQTLHSPSALRPGFPLARPALSLTIAPSPFVLFMCLPCRFTSPSGIDHPSPISTPTSAA